ncbi:MAG: hypothetical protein Wins2KO_26040 [Winogradskyella sp.]
MAQVNYGTPKEDDIPKKLQGIKVGIEVMHFPKENDPIKIKDKYYWKHATAILSKESDITIIEFGAFLFYNNQWNLRKSYDLKDLDKNFGTKKQLMKQGEPYVWSKNWRIDNQLFGGWAMWYFIGTDTDGESVCGYQTIHTTHNLLNK